MKRREKEREKKREKKEKEKEEKNAERQIFQKQRVTPQAEKKLIENERER